MSTKSLKLQVFFSEISIIFGLVGLIIARGVLDVGFAVNPYFAAFLFFGGLFWWSVSSFLVWFHSK